MEYDDFTRLLAGANSPIPEQKELHELLMQFKEGNYVQYISYNLMILNELKDPLLSQLAIVILFGEAKVGKIFEEQGMVESFLQSYLSLVPNLFQSQLLKDNIKIIVSTTLSLLAIRIFQLSGDTTIQQYIIQIYQSNQAEYETLVINCIMEIVIGCEGIGGFDDKIISEFLVMPLQKESSYIPRCKLFFGVVMSSPGSQELSQLFSTMYLQNPIPIGFMQEFLKIIIAFSEKHGEFFEPHLSIFIPQLCEYAANPQNEYRNLALFAFSAISTSASKMCQSMSEFYGPVINCLVQIMAEINKEDSVEYDPDAKESYLIARDQLYTISKNCDDNSDYYKCIENICTQTINQACSEFGIQNDEGQAFLHVPWQLSHAIVSAYNEIISQVGFVLLDISEHDSVRNCAPAIRKIQQFSPLLQSNQTVPSLRVEIMIFISNIVSIINCAYLQTLAEYILPILNELIINDDNQIIKEEAAKTLRIFFKSIPPAYLTAFYPDSFDIIFKILTQSPQYLYKPLLKCLTYFTRLREMHQRQDQSGIVNYINTLLKVYQSTEDINLKMSIVTYINFAISSLDSQRKQETEENQVFYNIIIKQATSVLYKLIEDIYSQAQSNQIDEYSNEKYYKVIHRSLYQLSDMAADFAGTLLPKTLEMANEEIQIEQIQKLETIEQTSLFIELQETQMNCRNFALISDINIVKNALSMMISILSCLKLNIRPFLQHYIETIQKWILNEFQIITIKSISWVILENLLVLFQNEPEFEHLMNLFFDYFNATIVNVPISLGIDIVNAMQFALKINKTWFDLSKISESLVKLELYTDKTIVKHRIEIEKTERFTGDHSSRDESKTEHYLEIISDLYINFLEKYPELTISYMEENHFIEKLTTLLNSSDISNEGHNIFIMFPVSLITSYLCKTKNIEMTIEWFKTLFDLADKRQNDPSCFVFKYMIKIFNNVPFPNEILENIEERFENYLLKIEEDENNDTNSDSAYVYSDWCLPAFASFISIYYKQIDDDTASFYWCKHFPIWEANEISDYGFVYLANLLNERNDNALNYDNFDRILDFLVVNIDDSELMKDETRENLKDTLIKIVRDPSFRDKALTYLERGRRNTEFALELVQIIQQDEAIEC